MSENVAINIVVAASTLIAGLLPGLLKTFSDKKEKLTVLKAKLRANAFVYKDSADNFISASVEWAVLEKYSKPGSPYFESKLSDIHPRLTRHREKMIEAKAEILSIVAEYISIKFIPDLDFLAADFELRDVNYIKPEELTDIPFEGSIHQKMQLMEKHNIDIQYEQFTTGALQSLGRLLRLVGIFEFRK